MHQHRTHHRTYSVEDAVGRKTPKANTKAHPVKDKAQPRIDDHRSDVELQGFPRLRADADHTDAYQLCYLASRHRVENLETPQQFKYELRDAVIRRHRQVHHYLDDEKDIDAAPEVVVHLLLFTGFLKCHAIIL